MLRLNKDDDIEALKDEVMQDLATILSKVDSSGMGVCVQASTVGSLEALLSFLEDSKIPVSNIAIGPVYKKDVIKASVMYERRPEFSTILAFDVPVTPEALQLSKKMQVKIFTAEIIYHLWDKWQVYMKEITDQRRAEAAPKAIFPVKLRIMPEFVFRTRDPLLLGCEVMEGILRKGTPLVVPERKDVNGNLLRIGSVISFEKEGKEQDIAKKGDQVAVKITGRGFNGGLILFERHFTTYDSMVSVLTRNSIDLLKANFKQDLEHDDWKLVKLKRLFKIQ